MHAFLACFPSEVLELPISNVYNPISNVLVPIISVVTAGLAT